MSLEVGDVLADLVLTRADALRPASYVMSPEVMGAARQHRYSFSRTLLRRAATEGWSVTRTQFDLDVEGRGTAVYRVDTGDHVFNFVAFTTTLAESDHSDRVVASAWEISACLVEGDIDTAMIDQLRPQVVAQERGRLHPGVLVLTRGNRSVRFFDYVIECLASGRQPAADQVGDAGYLMRSTAFYGNGKFGMRSFLGYDVGHPLRVPYRAQALAAWLFRELSLDTVEHCARLRGGDAAVEFDEHWRRYFGLGNATGLGLVPYAFNHPRVLHAWIALRELALANVVALAADPHRSARLGRCIDRAVAHFGAGTADDCTPFLSPRQLAPRVRAVRDAFQTRRDEAYPYRALYAWAETQDVETTELVVSLLIELDTDLEDSADALLRVEEQVVVDPAVTVADARAMQAERFGWIDDLALDDAAADHYWWVVSQNNEEPRRTPRARVDAGNHHEPIDVALRQRRLESVLAGCDPAESLAAVVARFPEQYAAVERLLTSDRSYGEPRDNACAEHYLPLQVQRLQLAMYGMDNFKPKSTDWLRVTFFQGAPRVGDLAADFGDDWIFPVLPETA